MSSPYSPQSNWVVESMNRTLAEKARAMLNHAGMKHCHWCEAVRPAADLHSRTDTTELKQRTPMEALFCTESDDSRIKDIGYAAFVHEHKKAIHEKVWT